MAAAAIETALRDGQAQGKRVEEPAAAAPGW
jgi:hypothetical protein